MDINVLMATKGKGVKVIVNSLSGTTLQTCLKCLAENGRFIQLGLAKADMENRQQGKILTYLFTCLYMVKFHFKLNKYETLL